MPRGAPKGNQNAKGHGAPKGNRNAETHGANSRPDTSNFTSRDMEQVECAERLSTTLGQLTAKRIDLEKRMAELNASEENRFVVSGTDTTTTNGTSSTVYWESKSTRAEKIEMTYIRVLNSILKVTSTIQKNAMEQERIMLERDKLKFSREKAMGIFESD